MEGRRVRSDDARPTVDEGATHRALVEAAIRRRPGIHLRELQRETALAWGTMTHHVHTLEREAAIRLVRGARYTCAFPNDAALPDAVPATSQRSARVLDVLTPQGVTSAEIRARLSMSPQLVSYHLKRLVTEGRAVRSPGRPVVYRSAPPHADRKERP